MSWERSSVPANPVKVLFVCTGNSARSQVAEALLNRKGRGRFAAESAGAVPAVRVNPSAVEVLQEVGIDWSGREPRAVAGLEREPWDLVITVCDNAREACPLFPGARAVAHWGLPDPTGLTAFRDLVRVLERRFDNLVALPFDRLDGPALAAAVNALSGV